uniref:F-box/WD repeat-containing protein 8-like n=1 Tax=Castor canadensis TaxID=51338 RepID=A0A8B7UIX2_CASCN|nr:F-box/WD repeat-containing protein 8-like [Castor canadensis]
MLATEVVLGRNSMRTVELGPHTALLGSSRVRIHDLRTDKIALSLSAHQLGVSAVQMDDWKIVSGGEEGLVSVWDYRMNQKLWEVHSRHPVRHISFNSHSLITANVPYERVVRNADLDNFATHRRHRGLIHAYEFAVDQLAFQSPLPICRSSCDTMAGYNYDLALAFPCDST